MVPLYAARIARTLAPATSWHQVHRCGHDMLIPPSSLLHGLRLPPTTLVLDLEPRLRCRECDARGNALVSVQMGRRLSSAGPQSEHTRQRNLHGNRVGSTPMNALICATVLAGTAGISMGAAAIVWLVLMTSPQG